MTKTLMIGTSGYSYDDWKGVFYPNDLPKNRMLEYYAGHFGCTEINATYYTIPNIKTFEKIALKVPADFEFIVKTHQETTHHRKENEDAINKLLVSLQPLIETEQLKGFLAQFPYSFKNNEQNRRYLAETRKLLKEHPLFVEFRHKSWAKPQLTEYLRMHGIGYVNVDEPDLPNLMPAQSEVTTSQAYIRFHGRNTGEWWDGQGSARYDYTYSEEELHGWLTRISSILKKAYKTYIFFNNHPNGQAIKNARQLIEIIEKRQKELFGE